MPKIPTYISTSSITTETPSIQSNIKLNVNNTPASALQPVGDFLKDSYIKEKKLEADNKAYALLSDMYIDQKDANGNIVQKGLFTIQSETKNNGEPTNAAAYNDQEVNKLYQYFKNNKFDGVDNFTKKAIESKYFSTAGILKTKSLEGSRNTQITDSTKIDEDYISKEAIVLKDVGPVYLEIYNQKVIDKINSNTNYDNGQKKILIETYKKFGSETLAESMANNQPISFKESLEKGQFDILSPEEKNKLISVADANILKGKFDFLLSDLKILDGKIGLDIINDFKGVKEGTFNGDVNKIRLFESLNPLEKKELINLAETQRSKSNAEINNINTGIKNQLRDEAIQNSVRVYDSYRTKGIFNSAEINQVFGDYEDDINNSTKQQFIELSTKQGNNELTKISNYYKNDEITSQILNGKIKDISTPFILQGENKPLSILQRAGDGINPDVDLKFYIDYLLPNIKDPTFVDDNKEFFKFIQKYQPQIEGPTYSKYVDKNLDNRLNQFKNDMFKKFIERRRLAEPTKDLLSKDSKKFIGHDISSYLPTQGDIERGILENFEQEGEKKYPPKLPNETKDEYLKRIGL